MSEEVNTEETPNTGESLQEQADRLPRLSFTRENLQWILLSVVAISYSLYHIVYGAAYIVNSDQHTMISLGFSIVVLIALLEVDLQKTSGKILFTLKMASIAVVSYITYYFVTSYQEMLRNILNYSTQEYIFGGILIAAVLILTWWRYGGFITAAVMVGIGYAAFGSYLPSFLQHSSIDFTRIIERSSLVFDIGLFGFLPNVGATWIVIFLVYAQLLIEFGALEVAIRGGQMMNKRLQSGVPQLAVVSSFVMGSISGSAAANTATTGAITIPLMKRYGMDGATAAAIESNASSGGQVLPPIMGASAFVMASLLAISYLDVITAALLPAILFYSICAISVYYISKDFDLSKPKDSDDQILELTTENRPLYTYMPLLISVLFLIYDLGVVEAGPLTAGFNAIMVLIGTEFISQLVFSDDRLHSMRNYASNLLLGLQKGAATSAAIMIVIGAIAIFVSMLGSGTIVQVLTFAMLDTAGQSLFLLLVIAMILSIIFGMGMPTVGAYVVVVVFVAPALTNLGIPELNAHIFVFYFAILSAITPPVALAAVIASGIADADFRLVAKKAMILGTPLFILPFTVIYRPSLVVWDSSSALTFAYTFIMFVSIIVVIHFNLDYNQYVAGAIKAPVVVLLVAILFWGTNIISIAGLGLALLISVTSYYFENGMPEFVTSS